MSNLYETLRSRLAVKTSKVYPCESAITDERTFLSLNPSFKKSVSMELNTYIFNL